MVSERYTEVGTVQKVSEVSPAEQAEIDHALAIRMRNALRTERENLEAEGNSWAAIAIRDFLKDVETPSLVRLAKNIIGN